MLGASSRNTLSITATISRDGNRFEPGGAQAQVVKPEQWSYIVGALDNPANSLSVRRAVKIHKCAGRHVLNALGKVRVLCHVAVQHLQPLLCVLHHLPACHPGHWPAG